MSGDDKLKTAKNHISQMVTSFKNMNSNCIAKYYKFDNDLHSITKEDFDKLSASGGTRIENAINKLYDKELPSLSQYKTKLMFVTDAEDTISDVPACKSKKSQCEGVSVDIILVGSSGSCTDALKSIFGSNSFVSCSNKNFKETFADLTESAEVSNKIHGDIPKQKKNTKQTIQKNNNNVQNNQSNVKSQKTNANKVDGDVNEVDNHNKEMPNKLSNHDKTGKQLTSTVDKAKTYDEKEIVDDAVEDELAAVKNDKYDLKDDEKKLKESENKLKEGVNDTKKTADQVKKDVKTFSNDVEVITKKIQDQCKELNTLKVGSKDEIAKAKASFHEILNDLEKQAEENRKLAMEISGLRRKYRKTFTNLDSGKIDNVKYQKQIKAHEDKLNALLEQLN
eukprot:120507_1